MTLDDKATWPYRLTDRQRKLVENCRQYARGDPAGLPGHTLMLTIARMADLLDEKERP